MNAAGWISALECTNTYSAAFLYYKAIGEKNMIDVKDLEWKKRDELYKGIAQLGFSIEEAKKIFEYLEDECVIEITSPKIEEPLLQTVKIQATHTGRFTGTSYKPGNIIFNIKDAICESLILGTSVAASIGAISMSQPVIAMLTILGAVLSAASLGKRVLDTNAVLILAVLWDNRGTYDQLIDAQTGLELVNKYLESYNRQKLSEVQYSDLLDDLSQVGSIVLNNGKIKLNEKIYIEY